MSRHGRKAALVLAGHVAGAAMGYAVLLLVGRYFDPRSYGSYLFAVGVVGVFALVANLGFNAAHQRHVAMGVDPGQALGVMVRIRLLLTGAFVAAVGLGVLAWTLVGGSFTDATAVPVLAAAVVLQAVTGTRQVLLDTWQGQQRVNRVEAVRFLDSAVAVAVLGNASLAIAHLTGRWSPLPGVGAFWADLFGLQRAPGVGEAALWLAGAYLAGKLASLAVASAWMARDRLQLGPWDPVLARSYARFALPVALTGAMGLVLQYTDAIMIGFFLTAREVGLYGAAQKLSVLASLLGAAVGTVLFPRFAQLHGDGDDAARDATFRHAERYLLVLCAPVAALLVALPGPVLHIAVGDRYLGAAGALRWLTLAAVVMTLEQPIASRFLGAGRTRLLVHSSTLNAVLNVALNLLFIPPQALGLGTAGAALATFASTGASYAYLRWRLRREHGTRLWEPGHPRILAAAAAVGAGLWWAGQRWPAWMDRWWELAGWGVTATGAFTLLLLAMGTLTADDRLFLRRVAHPGLLLAELRGR